MGFRLANVDGRAVLVHGDDYHDLEAVSGGALGADPMAALAVPEQLGALSATLGEREPTGALADVTLGPPVPTPQKSFGIGLNYHAHAAEGGMEVPSSPLVFTKFPSCLVGPTADLMQLAMAERKPRRRPLVVIADVSGSMERYAEMFLHFLHAAQGRLGRVETFVFATHLSRITREMRMRRPELALEKVSRAVTDWSGGTRIGEAIESFNRDWARRVTHGGAICLIISDGWDTGDPELLGAEMDRLARSVHRVIWLNPLAGRVGFPPATRGMQAALPYVDDLLAAGTLVDLRSVVRLLESIPARRGGRVAAHV